MLRLFGRRRVDYRFDFRDFVGGKPALAGVFTDQCFIGRAIDTVNLVASDITVDPLDLRPQSVQHTAGLL